jgi:hypothetical protein
MEKVSKWETDIYCWPTQTVKPALHFGLIMVEKHLFIFCVFTSKEFRPDFVDFFYFTAGSKITDGLLHQNNGQSLPLYPAPYIGWPHRC